METQYGALQDTSKSGICSKTCYREEVENDENHSEGIQTLGEKDITEKTPEEYKDVFSDIVNGLLFHGKQLVQEQFVFCQEPKVLAVYSGLKLRDKWAILPCKVGYSLVICRRCVFYGLIKNVISLDICVKV